MTNAESLRASAIVALNAKSLTSFEADFIRKIQGYSKKELKNLSSKQYDLLRQIAAKA